jgi:hypothetical protein
VSSTTKRGIFQRLRVRFLGERDAVEQRIDDMAKEGSGMAKVAHWVSLLMVVCFSAGSLVALSGEALATFLVQWQRGAVNVPAAISIAVSTLLVLAMDSAMIYAGLRLRLLSSRRAAFREKRLDIAIMAGVAMVESGTYLYMSSQYEHPAVLAAWALISARAIAAPILAIYLTLARAIPVTPGDILYQAELASGMTVLREIAERSADGSIPLARKMALFKAAAIITAEDRQRLDAMIQAVDMLDYRMPLGNLPPDGGPGGGKPALGLEDGRTVEADRERPESGHNPRIIRMRRPRRTVNGNGSGKASALSRYEKQELLGFAFLDAVPGATQSQVQAEVHCRPTTANKIMTRWRRRQRERERA